MRVSRVACGTTLALTALLGPAAPRAAQQPPALASAVAVRILQPGSAAVQAFALAAPPTATGPLQGYAYPADGSVLRITGGAGTAAVDLRHDAALAAVQLTGISLFGGEITADAVSATASAIARAGTATGNANGTAIRSLSVLGAPVQATPGLRVSLGSWGQALLLAGQGSPGTTLGVPSFRETSVAITIVLTSEHGGLPAGTRILLGSAAVFARVPLSGRAAPAQPARPAASSGGTKAPPGASSRAGAPSDRTNVGPGPDAAASGRIPPSLVVPPAGIVPQLTAKRYVFPVYGPVGYGDSFGAPRADTGWHHGDDIFAPLGAPVLAVTDGSLFSVGRERIGGNRLWLRDGSGNEFYYAHLSAYSPLAADGAEVKAGDVIGFVGNTGDAEGTPYHLHFEIHPATLLFLGEDGVVDPTPYLDAWRRVQDLRFPTGAAWAPAFAPTSATPVPGAILLASRDISGASGLDPASLRRALAPVIGGARP